MLWEQLAAGDKSVSSDWQLRNPEIVPDAEAFKIIGVITRAVFYTF